MKGDMEGGGRKFTGKIREGDCIEVSEMVANPPGLQAPNIAYFCDRCPRKGRLYHRSNTDQGMCGLLKNNVLCRIVVPHQHAIGTLQKNVDDA